MRKKTNDKKRKAINAILILLRTISIITIIICLIYIGHWYLENKKSANMLKEITDASIIDTKTIEIPVTEESSEEEQPKTIQIQTYELDFDKLFAVNKATIGWIYVPNTSINYPVAQASNNDFYLSHSFDNSKNTAGWIFADYRNKFDGTDKNIIIYGHNRVDTSMFATLKNTQKSYWYNNKNNKYITFTTPNGVDIYEVFSVYTIKMETYYLSTDFYDDDDFQNFLNTIKNRSIHNFGTSVNSSDSILTLSTCDATGKSRVVLHAKKIN